MAFTIKRYVEMILDEYIYMRVLATNQDVSRIYVAINEQNLMWRTKKEEKKRNETYVCYNTAYIYLWGYIRSICEVRHRGGGNKIINLNNNSLDHSLPQLLDRDYFAIIVAGDEHTYNETKVKFWKKPIQCEQKNRIMYNSIEENRGTRMSGDVREKNHERHK